MIKVGLMVRIGLVLSAVIVIAGLLTLHDHSMPYLQELGLTQFGKYIIAFLGVLPMFAVMLSTLVYFMDYDQPDRMNVKSIISIAVVGLTMVGILIILLLCCAVFVLLG